MLRLERHGFHTITLGCKLNQFDGAVIEGELARRGFVPEADPARAAVVVVNTCTVTHRADADARKLVRRIRRDNPGCRLLVTGCYAERDAASLTAVGGVDRVFGNRDKPLLPAILDELGLAPHAAPGPALPADGDRGCDGLAALPEALHFGRRTRAFLKVQDGCRLACSYCIIPSVRGPSRSVPPEAACDAAATLFGRGFREIVLTGVNTGDYGRDLAPPLSLAALLRRLLDATRAGRFRLNSLEPLTVTDEIVELLAREPRLCPHLQIPLQSGSGDILRAMRRNYRLEAYLERLTALRRAVPDIGLGADVIVGFPGETEAHFEETLRFIAASPLNYLHVFAWSPRGGTPAAGLSPRVTAGTVRRRSARLRALGDARMLDFSRRFVGRRLEAVVLRRAPEGTTRALTGNFIEVELPPGSARGGELIDVTIEAVDDRAVHARRATG